MNMNADIRKAFVDVACLFEAKETEVAQLRAEVERLKGLEVKLVEVTHELDIAKAKLNRKRKDFGIRSFVDHNGKEWYPITDIAAVKGYKDVGNSAGVLVRSIKYGSVRRFSYRELYEKIEDAPTTGVRCVDKEGMEEMLSYKWGRSPLERNAKKVLSMREEGKTYREIAKEMEVTEHSVYMFFKRRESNK